MQEKVDNEVRKLVEEALKRAREVLKKETKKLEELAKVLVEKESLDEKEFEEFMGKK